MKKVISVCLTLVLVMSLSAVAETPSFYDMNNHSWAVAPVCRLAEKGIIQGIAPHYYAPANYVSRAQLCTLLGRMFNIGGSGLPAYPDVPDDSYYRDSVAGLKALGILKTTSEGLFGPDDAVNREETMRITGFLLERFGFVENIDLSCLDAYPDSWIISDENRRYVATLVSMGFITGDDRGNLNPGGYLTRAEIAVLLDRLYSQLLQE